MGEKLVLVGGGGHCASVLDAVLRMKRFDEIVITDPELPKGSSLLGCTIAGSDEELPRLLAEGFTQAFITLGSIQSSLKRERLSGAVEALGFSFPVVVDPSAAVSGFSSVAEGSFIGKNAVVNASAVIGKHCIVNTGAIVEHDCLVEDFAHVSVGGILCGGVRVGRGAFVGAGSTVIQGLTVGAHSVVGAGAVVSREIPPFCTAVGVPARITREAEEH